MTDKPHRWETELTKYKVTFSLISYFYCILTFSILLFAFKATTVEFRELKLTPTGSGQVAHS